MTLVLMKETRAPRETPRLAWMLVALLGVTMLLPTDFGLRHRTVEWLKDTVGQFDPPAAVSQASRGKPQLTVPLDGNNRCRVQLTLNGIGPFFFFLDTGSPDTIANGSQAARLGYNLAHMKMDHTHGGWGGGHVGGIYVKLNTLQLGDFVLRDFEVSLDKEAGFHEGLLGITFLQRLRAFEIAGGECRLWW
jgi:clan AA aspartic protease (TIGR02281 family)